MQARAILFDFDGTLVQTRDASWKVFCETNRAFGLGVDDQQHYFELLEDNLFTSLRRLCKDDERGDQAANHFLGLLQTAYFPELVPGMSDVVRALAGVHSLAVLSSNSMAAIRRILTEAKIAHCFAHVFAGDVEPDKRASVRRFLTDESYAISRACAPAYREDVRPTVPTGEEVVLVTDTVGDVRHARECGIRAIGVSWGMHSEEKLLAAGAEMVALWPQEIVAHLAPGGFAAAACGCAVPASAAEPACACAGSCTCADSPERAAAAVRRERAVTAAGRLAAAFSGRPAAPAPRTDAEVRQALRRIGGRSGGPSPAPAIAPAVQAKTVAATVAAPDAALVHILGRLRPGTGPARRTAGGT